MTTRWQTPILLLLSLNNFGCSSPVAQVRREPAELRSEPLRQLPGYTSLKVEFTLKGRINQDDFYQEGSLAADEKNLTVELRDGIFRSKLFRLRIEGETLEQKDYLRNTTDVLPVSEFRMVQLFGHVVPFRFFYPFMKGYYPEELINGCRMEGSTCLLKDAGQTVLLTLQNDIPESMLYQSRGGRTIRFQFEGRSGKGRYYPGRIYITEKSSGDFLKLEFRSLRLL